MLKKLARTQLFCRAKIGTSTNKTTLFIPTFLRDFSLKAPNRISPSPHILEYGSADVINFMLKRQDHQRKASQKPKSRGNEYQECPIEWWEDHELCCLTVNCSHWDRPPFGCHAFVVTLYHISYPQQLRWLYAAHPFPALSWSSEDDFHCAQFQKKDLIYLRLLLTFYPYQECQR